MTGPEHYREAERLLAGAQNVMDVAPIDGLTRRECADLAQVHATLSLAAATAARLADPYIGDGDHINDWRTAIGDTTQPVFVIEGEA
ncbi:hypothetical protein [Streptomyces sp. NPDC054849]